MHYMKLLQSCVNIWICTLHNCKFMTSRILQSSVLSLETWLVLSASGSSKAVINSTPSALIVPLKSSLSFCCCRAAIWALIARMAAGCVSAEYLQTWQVRCLVSDTHLMLQTYSRRQRIITCQSASPCHLPPLQHTAA